MQMNTITHHGKIKKEAKLTFLSQDHHTTITCFPHNVRVFRVMFIILHSFRERSPAFLYFLIFAIVHDKAVYQSA